MDWNPPLCNEISRKSRSGPNFYCHNFAMIAPTWAFSQWKPWFRPHDSAIAPNEQILKPDNKPRRSEYVNTSNFTFPSSNTALGASFEVLWLASRCMVFQKHSPREALRATSKLAPNAAFELGKLKFKVCTYLERRCLLYGCKISSFDDILKRPRKL